MGELPDDIDRAAIEEHAQRTVEQTALRKVRRSLDDMEEAESARRRLLRYALIACAILAALGVLVFFGFIFHGKDDLPKAEPMQVPSALPQRQ